MNRWAANHPERFEELLADNGGDHHEAVREGMGVDQVSNEPCRVCGEITTRGGVACKRCRASLGDLDFQHVPGRD